MDKYFRVSLVHSTPLGLSIPTLNIYYTQIAGRKSDIHASKYSKKYSTLKYEIKTI